MKKLVKGIVEFRQHVLPQYKKTFERLALGQAPDTLFVACSDSRVVPNLFASTNPGDLFVIRNVGNLIPAFQKDGEKTSAEAAAIEFSLNNLPIDDIVICGHSECGAMQALTAAQKPKGLPALQGWLGNCTCSIEDLPQDERIDKELAQHNQFSQLNVLQQMEHLKTYPLIRQRLEEGSLNIHGWYFDIAKADVYAYEEMDRRFILIDETEAERIFARLH